MESHHDLDCASDGWHCWIVKRPYSRHSYEQIVKSAGWRARDPQNNTGARYKKVSSRRCLRRLRIHAADEGEGKCRDREC